MDPKVGADWIEIPEVRRAVVEVLDRCPRCDQPVRVRMGDYVRVYGCWCGAEEKP